MLIFIHLYNINIYCVLGSNETCDNSDYAQGEKRRRLQVQTFTGKYSIDEKKIDKG